MSSLILRTATTFLFPLMLLFSLFLLLRGHHHPGGGFSGGLVAAAGFVLHAVAFGPGPARRALRVEPRLLIGSGSLLAAASGVFGLVRNEPFLAGVWWHTLKVAPKIEISLGSPSLFDVGVYLVVIGAAVMILLSLMEE